MRRTWTALLRLFVLAMFLFISVAQGTASMAMHGDGHHPDRWEVEETFHAQGLGQVPLRSGDEGWGRVRIQKRHGWPMSHDGRINVRQKVIDTLASPEDVDPQGTSRVYWRGGWRVVVETGGNKGIITSY